MSPLTLVVLNIDAGAEFIVNTDSLTHRRWKSGLEPRVLIGIGLVH